MRPKARWLAQHNGPPGWVDQIDPAGVILYLMEGPYCLPFPYCTGCPDRSSVGLTVLKEADSDPLNKISSTHSQLHFVFDNSSRFSLIPQVLTRCSEHPFPVTFFRTSKPILNQVQKPSKPSLPSLCQPAVVISVFILLSIRILHC
jgi:hypothetical protein